MAAARAPDPQRGLLPPLRLGEDVARVPGEDRGKNRAGHSEEDEEPLRHGGIVGRHGQGVGDVVEQVVLVRGDARHLAGDSLGLADRGRRVGVESLVVERDVDLSHRWVLESVVTNRRCGLVGGKDARPRSAPARRSTAFGV